MFTREKIFTVYEKPEASDPADRMELLREGFSWGAFVFNLFWLLYKRMWLVALLYMGVATLLAVVAQHYGVSETGAMLMQLWLQTMLAFHAYDVQGWWLARRGYRFSGVLVAESSMHAERRYHEFAT